MVNNLISAIWCVCPFYSFFILMLIIDKINDNRKNKGKALNSSIEYKLFNNIDFFFQVIYSNIVYWAIGLFIIMIFIILVINSKINISLELFCQSNVLRLQKYIIEFLLNIVLAIIASIAVFYSLNKKYYVIFSFSDIMKVLKIKEKVILIVLYYIIICLCCGVYYLNYYSYFTAQYYTIVQTVLFMFFVYWTFLLFFKLLKFGISLYKFIFSNKTEQTMLDSLYLTIDKNDFNSFNIKEYDEVRGSLQYLLDKKLSCIKIQDSRINFVNFSNEYECFDFKLKLKMYLRMLMWSIFISIISLMILSNRFKSIEFNWQCILFLCIFNLFLCLLLFCKPSKKISIHILMWSKGLSVRTKKTLFYSSTLKNHITCRKYDNYFRNIYSIVCLFKYVLNSSNEQASICFINDLHENSQSNDYLLYALCLYFYYNKYRFKNSNKYLSDNFEKICDCQNINYKTAYKNVLEVLKYIDCSYDKNIFNASVGNIKCIKINLKKKN